MEGCWASMKSNDFTDSVPCYLSEDIFTLLDVPSLCHATEVSTRWNESINRSKYIWRRKYFSLNPSFANKMTSDSSEWKEMTIEAYMTELCKKSWATGDYSNITSYKDLSRCARLRPLTAEEWGMIFEIELSR